MHNTYDIIYQCSISDYAKAHGLSVESLIQKAQKDIELMKRGKESIFSKAGTSLSDTDVYAVEIINAAIEKKEAHVKRLKEWESTNGTTKHAH